MTVFKYAHCSGHVPTESKVELITGLQVEATQQN